ncbi:unnamed protein product [Cyclocybe aegerita]|uniref:DUF6534 domain-containing protein n=1 Tax=Cyclocybe aegerita TaxID=1973307 RepID=A0A8S0W858_CYCAE|nr:unnamed protein product [Cyclocybe aegerita]
MASDPAQVIPIDLPRLIGPQFVSALLNSILFGILSLQVSTSGLAGIFYLAFPDDPTYTKAIVYGIYILEAVQTALTFESGYRMYVSSFGDFYSLDQVGNVWLTVPILTAVGTVVVQAFYAYRVYLLSKSKAVWTIIMLLACTQFAAGIVTGILVKNSPFLSPIHFPRRIHLSLGIWHGGSALCDIVIAGAMVYYLSEFKPPVDRTRMMVQKIIRLTLETGTLTALVAVVALIFSLLPNNSANYQAVTLIFGKIYANSLMVLINRRVYLSSKDEKKRAISLENVGTSVSFRNTGVNQLAVGGNGASTIAL